MYWIVSVTLSCLGWLFVSSLKAVTRMDLQSGVDRLMFVNGYGHLIGLPTRPGESSTATTGVPSNSKTGFAPSALFLNFKGTVGTLVYVNTGTSTSTTWTNIV